MFQCSSLENLLILQSHVHLIPMSKECEDQDQQQQQQRQAQLVVFN